MIFFCIFSYHNHMQESTKQQGQIAKKPKTVPLQQADRELEEGVEQQVSKVGVV